MSVTKRCRNKKVFYEVSVYVKGHRLSYKCFEKKTEARIWHDREKEKLATNPDSLKRKNSRRTFLEVLELYKKEKIPLLALSTQQSIDGRYIYFTESPLVKVRMLDFSATHIDLWLNWIKKHPRIDHSKRKSFVQELRYLSAILHWYHHFIDPGFTVPIVKRHKMKCFYKPLKPRQPDYFMRPEDVRQWINYLKTRRRTNPALWRLASFMILTGVRVGEACGLTWDAIDIQKRTAKIFRKVGWDKKSKKPYIEERMKTKESFRILVLPREIVEMLKVIKKEHPQWNIIFTDKKGNLLSYGAIQAAFTRAFKALNLPWRSTHICRHTYATMALFATRDLSSVQASLGHANQRITERYAKIVKMISSDTAEKTAQVFKLFSNNADSHGQNTDEESFEAKPSLSVN